MKSLDNVSIKGCHKAGKSIISKQTAAPKAASSLLASEKLSGSWLLQAFSLINVQGPFHWPSVRMDPGPITKSIVCCYTTTWGGSMKLNWLDKTLPRYISRFSNCDLTLLQHVTVLGVYTGRWFPFNIFARWWTQRKTENSKDQKRSLYKEPSPRWICKRRPLLLGSLGTSNIQTNAKLTKKIYPKGFWKPLWPYHKAWVQKPFYLTCLS